MTSIERIRGLWEESKPHDALTEARVMLGMATESDLLELWEMFGNLANMTSDAALAEASAVLAADACQQLYRSVPRRYPLARTGLASWYLTQKRFRDARAALEWGIRATSAQERPHPVTILELYQKLAEVAGVEGEPHDQAALLQRALDGLAPRALKHPDRERARAVESVRTMLARVREELGELDAAARAIEEKLRASALTSADDAIDLAHLAELRASQGQFDAAQNLMRRAIRISDSKCEPTEPRRGRWVAALARIHESAGRSAEALAGFRRARELLLKAYPPPTTEELHDLDAAIHRNSTST